jgi:hypothetical protein
MLFHVFGMSGIIKREAQPPHLPQLVATQSQHTTLTLSKEYAPWTPSSSSTHVPSASNQPASKQKNSEQNAHYLLTTFWDAGQGELTHPGHVSQRGFSHAVRILLLFIIGDERDEYYFSDQMSAKHCSFHTA